MKRTFIAEKNEYNFKTTTTQERLEMQVTAWQTATGKADSSQASTSSSKRRKKPGFANANAA